LTKKISVSVGLKDYKADDIRYAAYAVSGSAYVFLEPGKKGEITVTLEPKPAGAVQNHAALEKKFIAELKDEKMRSAIADANRELRDFIVLKALTSVAAPAPAEDSGFTPAQEKELDDLIAQVEREIKTETAGKQSSDPLGITKTWEEKHDAKPAKSKSRK
jgi:His-Xaa-Ser system protein HxsD